MIVTEFFQAFRAGKELANAEAWKNAQVIINSLVAILTLAISIAALFGYPLNLDAQGIQAIAAGTAAAVGVFNGTATVVSTSRIGLPSVPDDGPGSTKPGVNPQPPEPRDADVFGAGYRG